jgi:hypothetical protein
MLGAGELFFTMLESMNRLTSASAAAPTSL